MIEGASFALHIYLATSWSLLVPLHEVNSDWAGASGQFGKLRGLSSRKASGGKSLRLRRKLPEHLSTALFSFFSFFSGLSDNASVAVPRQRSWRRVAVVSLEMPATTKVNRNGQNLAQAPLPRHSGECTEVSLKEFRELPSPGQSEDMWGQLTRKTTA